MSKYMFLIQGKKGLYTSDGVKIYFPDRGNKTYLTRGIAGCYISKDFDKYGFIQGEMVKNVGTLEDAVVAGKVDLNSVQMLWYIGSYEYWVQFDEVTCSQSYCAYIDDEVVVLETSGLSVTPERNKFNFLYDLRSQSKDFSDYLRHLRVVYAESIILNLKPQDRNVLIECIVRSLSIRIPDSIKIYDNKIIAIQKRGFYNEEYFYCDGSSLLSLLVSSLNTGGYEV